MSQKNFEIDKLEERIAPSTLAIGSIIDHAVSGNAVASGNSTSLDAGHNSTSLNPTIDPTTSANPTTVASSILNNVLQSSDSSSSSGGGGLLGL